MKAILVSIVAFVLLAGCGGDGKSSSGGGTSLAGNYIGVANFTFTGPGGSFRFSERAVLLVASNGEVGFALLAATDDAVCSPIPRVFLNGRNFAYQFSYTCRYASLGSCQIAESGRGSISGVTATASVNGAARCTGLGNTTVSITGTFRGTKGASLSGGSKSQVESNLRNAFGL